MKLSIHKLGIAMISKKWNYKQLSEESGVSRATLSSINCGKRCSVTVFGKLAAALGVDPAELLESEGRP